MIAGSSIAARKTPSSCSASGDLVFHGGKLARLQVGELLLCRHGGGTIRHGSGAESFRRDVWFGLCLLRALPNIPLGVVAEPFRSAQTIQAENDGRDPVQHEAIVRDQHQGAAVFQQAFFQDFQSRDIQIVGGFIQQQDVRRLQHELRDQDAGPFASGEPPDRPIQVVWRKEKPCCPRGDVNHSLLINHRIAVGRKGAA